MRVVVFTETYQANNDRVRLCEKNSVDISRKKYEETEYLGAEIFKSF